jgi:hypothetical protein
MATKQVAAAGARIPGANPVRLLLVGASVAGGASSAVLVTGLSRVPSSVPWFLEASLLREKDL